MRIVNAKTIRENRGRHGGRPRVLEPASVRRAILAGKSLKMKIEGDPRRFRERMRWRIKGWLAGSDFAASLHLQDDGQLGIRVTKIN